MTLDLRYITSATIATSITHEYCDSVSPITVFVSMAVTASEAIPVIVALIFSSLIYVATLLVSFSSSTPVAVTSAENLDANGAAIMKNTKRKRKTTIKSIAVAT